MTQKLVETLETSIYSLKHIKNTKTHVIFKLFKMLENQYFPPKQFLTNQSFILICTVLFIFDVEDHTA